MKSRKSWREKVEAIKEVRVVDDPKGRGKMLIPRPLDVEALINKVSRGKLVTDVQIRERLAKQYSVDITCPLATGIFLRIIAEAAEEDRRSGRRKITPYWRVVKNDGSLNPKFPGGVDAQAKKLVEEGHEIGTPRGKKPPKVCEFEKFLFRF